MIKNITLKPSCSDTRQICTDFIFVFEKAFLAYICLLQLFIYFFHGKFLCARPEWFPQHQQLTNYTTLYTEVV